MTSYPITSAPIETHYVEACEQFEHLIGRLEHPDTQKLTHGEVEAVIHSEGMELLRRMTQGHLNQRSAQEPYREKVIGEDGRSRTHHRAIPTTPAEGCASTVSLRRTLLPSLDHRELGLQDYFQSADATLEMEFSGLVAGTEYEWVDDSGEASLGGILNVSLFDTGSGLFA